MATDPLDDTPPEEELDMAVEEAIGRPLAGNPAERIDALQKRIQYLLTAIENLTVQEPSEFGQAATASYRRDLIEARRQLAEYQHQNEARN